jgi:transcriptional regulator with XRE-family HTH domain
MSKDPVEESFNEAIRERLKKWREEKKLKQEDVANEIGISLARYKKLETRDAMPCYLLPRVARIMHVSVAFLVIGHDEK